jgi:FkbM family methyltransferase
VRTFWLIWCAGTYPTVESDRVIVDAGANIGAFTIYALIRAPGSHVIAIEPAPDTFDRLKKMIVANRMQERCNLLNAALGRMEGKTHIDLRAESQFRQTGRGPTEVRLIPLATVIDQPVDFLKMDIEGAELEAVSGAPLAQVKRIAMEFHPNVSLGDLVSNLRLHGFGIKKVREDGGGYGILWAAGTGITPLNHDSPTYNEEPSRSGRAKGKSAGFGV